MKARFILRQLSHGPLGQLVGGILFIFLVSLGCRDGTYRDNDRKVVRPLGEAASGSREVSRYCIHEALLRLFAGTHGTRHKSSLALCSEDLWLEYYVTPRTAEQHLDVLRNGAEQTKDRAIAARYLGSLKCLSAVPSLIELLNAKDPMLRRAVMDALGRIGDKRAVVPLVHCLGDTAPYETTVYQYSLPAGPVQDYDFRTMSADITEMGLGTNANSAAIALGLIGDSDAVQGLLPFLKEKGDSLGRSFCVARALGNIGDRRALSALKSATLSHYAELSEASKAAIAQINGKHEPAGVLIEDLRCEDKYVRFCAAENLGRIGSLEAVPYLRKVVDDDRIAGGLLSPRISYSVGDAATRAIWQIRKRSEQQ